jgi:predicted nucleic acid-binding protein
MKVVLDTNALISAPDIILIRQKRTVFLTIYLVIKE